jgi:hypothetical protein
MEILHSIFCAANRAHDLRSSCVAIAFPTSRYMRSGYQTWTWITPNLLFEGEANKVADLKSLRGFMLWKLQGAFVNRYTKNLHYM